MIRSAIFFFTCILANFLHAMHEIPLTPKTHRAPTKISSTVLPTTHSQRMPETRQVSELELEANALLVANSYVYDKSKKVMVPIAKQSIVKSSDPELPSTQSKASFETQKDLESNLRGLMAAYAYVHNKYKKTTAPAEQQEAPAEQPKTKKRSTPYPPPNSQSNLVRTKTYRSTEELNKNIKCDCDNSVVSVKLAETPKPLTPQIIPLELINKEYIMVAAINKNKKVVSLTYSSKNENTLFYYAADDMRFALEHETTPEKKGHKFNPDCSLLLTLAGKFLYIWDLQTQTIRKSWIPHVVKYDLASANFDASGKYIITTCKNGEAAIWETLEGKQIRFYKITDIGIPRALIENSSFNTPFERILLSKTLTFEDVTKNRYCPYNQLCMYTTSSATEQKLDGDPHTSNIVIMTLSNDCKLAVTHSNDETTKIWNIKPYLPGHELRHTIKHKSRVRALAISNNSSYIAIAFWKSVLLYDCATGNHVLTLNTEQKNSLDNLQFNADDTALFGHTETALLSWDLMLDKSHDSQMNLQE